MSEPMPTDDAGEPRIGIPRQIRDGLLTHSHSKGYIWVRDYTYPVDPPWVPDPATVVAMDNSGCAPGHFTDAAARLTRLHDAGWELTRTEAPR